MIHNKIILMNAAEIMRCTLKVWAWTHRGEYLHGDTTYWRLGKVFRCSKQKNKIPAQPEASWMNRSEFVKAPHPTGSQKSSSAHQTKTEPDWQPPSRQTQRHISAQTCSRKKSEVVEGFVRQKPRHSFLKIWTRLWARMSDGGFYFLLEKYWQCGVKSHHNKEMHTLFNSILTYKKLFSTSL